MEEDQHKPVWPEYKEEAIFVIAFLLGLLVGVILTYQLIH